MDIPFVNIESKTRTKYKALFYFIVFTKRVTKSNKTYLNLDDSICWISIIFFHNFCFAVVV